MTSELLLVTHLPIILLALFLAIIHCSLGRRSPHYLNSQERRNWKAVTHLKMKMLLYITRVMIALPGMMMNVLDVVRTTTILPVKLIGSGVYLVHGGFMKTVAVTPRSVNIAESAKLVSNK